MSDSNIRYIALALQTRCDSINNVDKPEARAMMRRAIDRIDEQIRGSFVLTGPSLRLVVLPEYFMSGYPVGETITGWTDKAAIELGGEEYEALSAVAAKHKIFLSGNAYETDSNFPGFYFQVCFIIAPNGDVILRYRRLTSAFEMTPHDVLDKYLDIYGIEGLFPVADTEIGRLGCIASEEIMWPELVRAMCLRGTEVLLHPTSEPGSPKMTDRQVARKARAMENHIYIVASNTASIDGTPIPAYTCSANSCVVD